MRTTLQARLKAKNAARKRHRRKTRRFVDPFESGDDDDEVVEIGGGPSEDRPSSG